MTEQSDWIQTWIDDRFGVPNTFNKQLLVDFLAKVRPIIEKQERERVADWIVDDCDEIRDPNTDELVYYGVKPEEIQALKKGD